MGAADASRRFAYSGVVVGTLPSHRLADDVPLLATPRHPSHCSLTVCNQLANFKFTNFGGTKLEIDYTKPFSNYVIARSDCPCRDVAIPRKGTIRL